MGGSSVMATTTMMNGENMRAAVQGRVAQMRENARERLAHIRDKVKQRLAQRLSAQFDHVNKVWTDHFTKELDRYDAVLQKIQDRANRAALHGKDVAATNAAVQTAKAAIASARAAVQAQAAKSYTLDLSPANTSTATSTDDGQVMQEFRAAFQALHTQLFHDLFALRDGPMKDAHKAAQNALQTLKQIAGIDNEHATSTASEATSTNE